MKILVAYYSRTGTTKKVGDLIAEKLKADVEEIIDTVDRSGAKGWLYAGRAGMKKELTKIKRPKLDPADYDLVIVGTPIWSWNVSPPTRTYLTAFKGKFKKVAFYCTMSGSGSENAFKDMEEASNLEPTETLALTTKEVTGGDFQDKLEKFTLLVQGK